MSSPDPNNPYHQVWASFNANVGSFWLFSAEVGKLADAQDRAAADDFAQQLAQYFKRDAADVDIELKQLILNAEGDVELTPDNLTQMAQELPLTLNSTETRQSLAEWAKQNPREAPDFAVWLRAAFANLPAHGRILRRGALMVLVTFLETLVARLADIAHARQLQATVQPRAGRSTEGSSTDDWADRSFRNQLTYLTRQLKANSRVLDALRIDLDEIIRRRNLFVHNNGKVNDAYSKHLPKHYLESRGITPGCLLQVSTPYLAHALDTVQLYGNLLNQVCWRQWLRGDRDQADQVFSDFVYNVLVQRRFDLVLRAAPCADTLKLAARHRRDVLINHTIAARELGRRSSVRRLLNKTDLLLENFDPRSMPLAVEIALRVLREDFPGAIALLNRARITGEIQGISMNWPLFRPMRELPQFLQVFADAPAER